MSSRKLRQTGFGAVAIIAVIFVLVAVAGAGLVVAKRSGATKTPAPPSPASPVAKTPPVQPQQPVDPYAGWQTARLANEKLGFRYPADWMLAALSTGETINVESPASDGRSLDVSLMAGRANTDIDLNLLGESSGTTVANLHVPGATQPLYLDAQTWSTPDKITCLGLATTPGTQDHKTSFGILDDGGKGQHNIVMSACLNVGPQNTAPEYSADLYTSDPHYQTAIKIFQSLNYRP